MNVNHNPYVRHRSVSMGLQNTRDSSQSRNYVSPTYQSNIFDFAKNQKAEHVPSPYRSEKKRSASQAQVTEKITGTRLQTASPVISRRNGAQHGLRDNGFRSQSVSRPSTSVASESKRQSISGKSAIQIQPCFTEPSIEGVNLNAQFNNAQEISLLNETLPTENTIVPTPIENESPSNPYNSETQQAKTPVTPVKEKIQSEYLKTESPSRSRLEILPWNEDKEYLSPYGKGVKRVFNSQSHPEHYKEWLRDLKEKNELASKAKENQYRRKAEIDSQVEERHQYVSEYKNNQIRQKLELLKMNKAAIEQKLSQKKVKKQEEVDQQKKRVKDIQNFEEQSLQRAIKQRQVSRQMGEGQKLNS